MPYRGLDEWTRLVIGARRHAARRRRRAARVLAARAAAPGFPLAALILLVALYAVPAVVLNFDGEFLRGALLAVLVLAFLRLEKLRGATHRPRRLVAARAAPAP